MTCSLVIQPAAVLMNHQGKNVPTYIKNMLIFMISCMYRIEVEYISNSTNCAWMPITHSVTPNSCNDLSTTYFQPMQLISRCVHTYLWVSF